MNTTVLVTDLCFAEGPRWRDGRLYFSDFYRHEVLAVDPAGALTSICTVPNQPSGLGWLPDGRMLIVSMLDRRVLRLEADGRLELHADLSAIATFHCNDMVIDRHGRAYVGNFGFDNRGGVPRGADLALVEPDGSVRRVATDLRFPNGAVITPDGQTLIIGETHATRMTSYRIAADGSLSDRRLWADIAPHRPDGCCLDAQGAIWVADPRGKCVVRVAHGGAILARVDLANSAFACMLGGADGRTLFICTAPESGPPAAANRAGRIETLRVDVPHAGLP